MKLLTLLTVYCLVIVALIAGSIMVANACDGHEVINTKPQEETLIFKPDGSAEYCTETSPGIVYCR